MARIKYDHVRVKDPDRCKVIAKRKGMKSYFMTIDIGRPNPPGVMKATVCYTNKRGYRGPGTTGEFEHVQKYLVDRRATPKEKAKSIRTIEKKHKCRVVKKGPHAYACIRSRSRQT